VKERTGRKEQAGRQSRKIPYESTGPLDQRYYVGEQCSKQGIFYYACIETDIGLHLHCNKTFRRIPLPWPDGAGVIGQGKGKCLNDMGRKFPAISHSPRRFFPALTGKF